MMSHRKKNTLIYVCLNFLCCGISNAADIDVLNNNIFPALQAKAGAGTFTCNDAYVTCSSSKITTFNVTQVWPPGIFTGTIPSTIGQLTKLQHFIVTFNWLRGAIPTQIGLLTELKTIDLRGNHLVGTIPTEIKLLNNLEKFTVHRNRFSGPLPDLRSSFPSLSECWLWLNESAVAREFSCFTAQCPLTSVLPSMCLVPQEAKDPCLPTPWTCVTAPSPAPSVAPSAAPTAQPTRKPTKQPTKQPTKMPTHMPTGMPSRQPTLAPLIPGTPTAAPTPPTNAPTRSPTPKGYTPPPNTSPPPISGGIVTSNMATGPLPTGATMTDVGGGGTSDANMGPPGGSEGDDNMSVIVVGGAIGGVCLLLIIAIILFCILRRRRSSRPRHDHGHEMKSPKSPRSARVSRSSRYRQGGGSQSNVNRRRGISRQASNLSLQSANNMYAPAPRMDEYTSKNVSGRDEATPTLYAPAPSLVKAKESAGSKDDASSHYTPLSSVGDSARPLPVVDNIYTRPDVAPSAAPQRRSRRSHRSSRRSVGESEHYRRYADLPMFGSTLPAPGIPIASHQYAAVAETSAKSSFYDGVPPIQTNQYDRIAVGNNIPTVPVDYQIGEIKK